MTTRATSSDPRIRRYRDAVPLWERPPPLIVEDLADVLAPFLHEIETRGAISLDPGLLLEDPWHDKPLFGSAGAAALIAKEAKEEAERQAIREFRAATAQRRLRFAAACRSAGSDPAPSESGSGSYPVAAGSRPAAPPGDRASGFGLLSLGAKP